MGDAWIDQVIPCRGCENEGYEQYDAHGISTGYWCYDCYESSKYPYRKDRYETIETHGYGERLSDGQLTISRIRLKTHLDGLFTIT